VISFIFYKKIVIRPVQPDLRKNHSLARSSIAMCIILLLFQVAGYFIADLVINSAVPLNLQNISGLTYQSGFGLFIISVLLFSLWLVSVRLFDAVFVIRGNLKGLVFSFILVIAIYFGIYWLVSRTLDWIVPLFFTVYFLLFWYLKSKNRPLFSVQQLFIFLSFYAIFGTFLLNRSNQTKEDEKIKLLAGKLVTQRNPVTEILYEQIEHRLKTDSILSKWMTTIPGGNKVSEDSLVNYLLSQYFNEYWKKYQVQITLCGPAKELRVQPQGYLVNCNAYFQEIIRNYGKATALPNLFFLDYGYGKEYYLSVISENPLVADSAEPGIFIELNLKNAYPDQGYPGLLMDKTRLDLTSVSDYSYGLYQNGLLIRSVGPTGYKTDLKKYPDFPVTKPFFTDGQWVHYFYRINDNDTLLISKKKESFLTVSTPFSYLFIIFSSLVVLISVLVYFPKNRLQAPASLRNRLHFSLLGILVVTLLAIGIVQVANIVQINLKKNVDNLRERAISVVVEVQHKYGSLPGMKSVARGEQEDFLTKLSNVFFTDINIYSEKGLLLSSSRPQVFEEGLQSERMDAAAYQKLIEEKNSLLIHYESIGEMQFNSAYLPFYNDRDKLLGFVNLPYFARQDESKKEISTFLVTFLNVYILLILFGVFVTVLITNYITAPLAMLAGKMSQLRLGMVNEKIAWKQNDEIGQLVSEYNKMIDKLGNSAEILARSERESAWRQMARQVAHEIKNPLTPMKLSAQYLEKAWNDKAPDWEQRLARFTVTLVEQIDALSVIASDFSNFAQMPTVAFSPIDMNEVLQFVRTLYQDTPAVRYEFHSDISAPVIFGDRSQLIRLFTNLLNNAIQAIGEQGEGVIRIEIVKEHEQIIVKVSDNGCGISPQRSDRIFQPDFTTKTSGMGLGLAIVKGIVEGMGGEISFVSEEHKGTTFNIKFPIYGEESK
jgi:signal transduction histidine kinase